MKFAFYLWIAFALILCGYDAGNTRCGFSTENALNPIIFLAWPVAVVAILGGWESEEPIETCG